MKLLAEPRQVVAYWLRDNGQKLSEQDVRATARDAWLWIGHDPFRGPTPVARLAIDCATAASPSAPCIEVLDHAEILRTRADGVLVTGRTQDLSRARTWDQRRQTWWCVFLPLSLDSLKK